MYSQKDAIDRVLIAKTSSLDPDEINWEYLATLRVEVKKWLEAIEKEEKEYLNQHKYT